MGRRDGDHFHPGGVRGFDADMRVFKNDAALPWLQAKPLAAFWKTSGFGFPCTTSSAETISLKSVLQAECESSTASMFSTLGRGGDRAGNAGGAQALQPFHHAGQRRDLASPTISR